MTHFDLEHVKPGYYATKKDATTAASGTTCRCCHHPMHASAQLFLSRGFYGLVTCHNEGCDLNAYTFSTTTYAHKDLSRYSSCFAPPTHQEL